MKRLNIGCGFDYRKDWVNMDFNKGVKADVYHNFEKLPLPFKDNEFDFILLDNVLEHVKSDIYLKMIDELWRIGKKGAIIEIWTPHYSGMYASKHPTHHKYFGIGSFDTWRVEEAFNGERYGKARFRIKEEKLLFFHHKLANMKFLSILPINWIFNFGRFYRQLMERFMFLGFDEIMHRLEVVK